MISTSHGLSAPLLTSLNHLLEWPQLWVDGCQHLLMGLPGLSKVAVIGIVTSWSSLWGLVSVVGHDGPGGSQFLTSFWYGSTPLHWRHSSMEDKMSWANSCAHSGLHGGGPGSLFSWYTLLYSSCISPQEVLYSMSWMAGTSTLASGLGVPCWWPQQMTHSISFWPDSVPCRNILWSMNGQLGPPAFH